MPSHGHSNYSVLIFQPIEFIFFLYFYVTAEGAENGLEFTIVRPFNWIGPRMDFIPGIDGPSEGVPRVLACFSNVCLYQYAFMLVLFLVLLLTAYLGISLPEPIAS